MAQPGEKSVSQLYKYRSMDGGSRDYTLAILKNLELRYSPASSFNDPFDCNLDLALRSARDVEAMMDKEVERAKAKIRGLFSKANQAARQWLEKRGANLPPRAAAAREPEPEAKEPGRLTIRTQDSSGRWHKQNAGKLYTQSQSKQMVELYRILDESFGVLCLSERPDDVLLWSHYGSSHRGLCLEFDVVGHPGVFPRHHPVVYQKRYPTIPTEFPQILEAFRDKAEGMITETLLDVASALAGGLAEDIEGKSPTSRAALCVARWFYVKSSFWSYEREWRCLKCKPGFQSFPPQALTRIIIGCVDTEANLKLVRAAIEGTAIEAVPLYTVVRKARKFGLNIVRAE